MISGLERVVVVGTSCCGKTSYSRQLAAILRHPHIELDALYWKPNWVAKSEDEFTALVTAAISADRWIVDGNYGTARNLIWSRATCIMWLNYGFLTVLARAFRRTFRRAMSGEELYSGNKENFRKAFFNRDSILLWVVTTYERRRREYAELQNTKAFPHLQWFEFPNPAEARQFLRSPTLADFFYTYQSRNQSDTKQA